LFMAILSLFPLWLRQEWTERDGFIGPDNDEFFIPRAIDHFLFV
jgi:hypothetical protein